MVDKQEFANLQVLCDKERRVAKKVYEALYKGYKMSNANVLWHQFDYTSKTFGCKESLSDDAKRSMDKLFNATVSPPYFLRKYDDGWTSILHNRFCPANIASYALQYSRNAREHPVVALGYDNEQFLCIAFQDGKTIFNYNTHRKSKEYAIPKASEIVTFAEVVGCTQEDVLQMIDVDYQGKTATISRIFKHTIITSAEKIKPAERSLYIEVSSKGLWY